MLTLFLSRGDIEREYPALLREDPGYFKKLFEDREYSVKVKPGSQGVIHAPRRLPHTIKGCAKTELDCVYGLHVLAEQREPTELVSSMVCTMKGDKIRICLDPTDVNKVIMHEHYPTVTVEEVAAEIGEDTDTYSMLDARHGYWHVPLD